MGGTPGIHWPFLFYFVAPDVDSQKSNKKKTDAAKLPGIQNRHGLFQGEETKKENDGYSDLDLFNRTAYLQMSASGRTSSFVPGWPHYLALPD